MTYLDCQDEFSVVSVLVCLVTHQVGSMVNHDLRLSDCHDSPSYYVAWTLNLERMTESMMNHDI